MGAPWVDRKSCIGCSKDIWNGPESKNELDPENEQCDECYREYAATIERIELDDLRELTSSELLATQAQSSIQ